jgi:hypothetical protein
MSQLTCPNCHHHKFEVKPFTGNSLLNAVEKSLFKIGIPTKWFRNLIIRCKTCKYFWRA